MAIASLSTVVLIAALVILVVNTPGWPKFRAKFFDLSYGWQVLPDIAEGLWLNIRLMVVCEIVILVLAMAVALSAPCAGRCSFRCAPRRSSTPTCSAACH